MGNYMLALRRTPFRVTIPNFPEGYLRSSKEVEFYPYQYLCRPHDHDADKLAEKIEKSWYGADLPRFVINGHPFNETKNLCYAYELMERKVGLFYNDGSTNLDGSALKIGNIVGYVKFSADKKATWMTCREGLIHNIEAAIPTLCVNICPENKPLVDLEREKIELLKSLPNEPGFQDGDKLLDELHFFARGYQRARMRLIEEGKRDLLLK